MPKLKPVWMLPSFTKIRDPAAKQWAKELSLLLTDLIRDIALAGDVTRTQVVEVVAKGRSIAEWQLRVATAADAIAYDVIEGNLYYFHTTGGVRAEIEAAD